MMVVPSPIPQTANHRPQPRRNALEAVDAPRRVLVITLQRLGDVLLTTPLLHSLRRAWPQATIDALVFEGTGAALEGNTDVAQVIEWPKAASLAMQWKRLQPLRRRYDWALVTQPGDKPHLIAAWAASRRVGVAPPDRWQDAWKRASCTRWLAPNERTEHVVVQNLALAQLLGVEPCVQVVPPLPSAGTTRGDASRWTASGRSLAVLHPQPMFRYKAWPTAHWTQLARALSARGLQVLLSGGPAPAEHETCTAIAEQCPGVVNLAGKLRLADWTVVLRSAVLFVGPDTVTTHLAAAAGTPTVALFGPSSPVRWGPWPLGAKDTLPAGSPWRMKAPLQHQNHVLLLQGLGDCVPCLQEGCERHTQSPSRCLEELELARVLAAVDSLLENRA